MIERRGKQIAVVLTLLALAAVGFAPTRLWARVSAPETEDFSLTGAELSSALPALALAIAAMTLALIFATRRLAVVIAAALAIGGAAIVLLTLRAPTPDAAAVRQGLESRTGVTHIQPDSFAIDWSMPALTIVGGVAALAAACWILATSHRWRRRERSADRYERGGALAWDVLDDGDDPTLDTSEGGSVEERARDSD